MTRRELTKSAGILAIACVATLAAGLRSVEACSCVTTTRTAEQERQHVVDELVRAVAVFSGEVVAQETGTVRIRLGKVWKGDIAGEVTMRSGPQTTADGSVSLDTCDYSFTVGKKYLVFTYNGSLSTMRARVCTYTSELEKAAAIAAILDELAVKKD